jgi:septal ring factor EnvC (AmiA/AmiB activator)
MSNLESKAFWVKVPIIGGNPNVQVVTLEFAQKEIGEQRGIIKKQKVVIDELNTNYLKLNEKFDSLHDDFILQSEAWQKTINKNKASEAKIEATNKALQINRETVEAWIDNEKRTGRKVSFTTENMISLIDQVSTILIPRKEPQETTT